MGRNAEHQQLSMAHRRPAGPGGHCQRVQGPEQGTATTYLFFTLEATLVPTGLGLFAFFCNPGLLRRGVLGMVVQIQGSPERLSNLWRLASKPPPPLQYMEEIPVALTTPSLSMWSGYAKLGYSCTLVILSEARMIVTTH